MIGKIISGGQTGVDRAALDVAMEFQIPCGGYCPKGRLAEDGTIPERYPLTEMDTDDYPARTQANIDASDATLLLHEELPLPTSPGSRLTLRLARESGKPWKQVNIKVPSGVAFVAGWLRDNPAIKVLNVAGPRASKCRGIHGRAAAFLRLVLSHLKEEP